MDIRFGHTLISNVQNGPFNYTLSPVKSDIYLLHRDCMLPLLAFHWAIRILLPGTHIFWSILHSHSADVHDQTSEISLPAREQCKETIKFLVARIIWQADLHVSKHKDTLLYGNTGDMYVVHYIALWKVDVLDKVS